MTLNSATKLARTSLLILEYCESSGMNVDTLLDAARLDRRILNDPDSRVPLSAQLRLWRAVIEQSNDPGIGLQIGRSASAKKLGVVGYAMHHSETLSEALSRFARYLRIISEAILFSVAPQPDAVRLELRSHPSFVALRHPVEAQLVALLTLATGITGQDIVPTGVELPTPPVDDIGRYRDTFGCSPRFDRPAAAIVLTHRQLALPVTAADQTLGGYLAELANSKLGELREPDENLVSAVRRALWSRLSSGKPALQQAATTLGVSSRTLQRRLHDAGSSYSGVLEDLRRELSTELLSTGQFAVADVAFLLGYSEPSAFQRAFRRWHGVSPSQFKQNWAA